MASAGTNGRGVNGLDPEAVAALAREIEQDPARGRAGFRIRSVWRGQARSRGSVEPYSIGGRLVYRHFTVDADEPFELLGRNTAPNPQELLLAALNACLLVGYAAAAARRGIVLEQVEIETSQDLDLRDVLAEGPAERRAAAPIRCQVRLRGQAAAEQLREMHEVVLSRSPNVATILDPVPLEASLVVEESQPAG